MECEGEIVPAKVVFIYGVKRKPNCPLSFTIFICFYCFLFLSIYLPIRAHFRTRFSLAFLNMDLMPLHSYHIIERPILIERFVKNRFYF